MAPRGASFERYFRIYRAVVFPGARATREVWAALVRDGRCSRVAPGGKTQFSRGGRQERQGFPMAVGPALRDAKAQHLSEPRATC